MSELRKDPVTGRWIIFATEFRQQQPTAPGPLMSRTPAYCPFCAGNESLTPAEIYALRPPDSKPNAPDWKLRVIPNKFPVLRIEGLVDPRPDGLYDKLNGIGANEVLIVSPDHNLDLDSLPGEQVEAVLWTLRERFMDLKRDVRIQYLLAYKNHGELAGATLGHPHFQLMGLPVIPKTIAEELEGVRRHLAHRSRCLFCDILHQDIRRPERLVLENEQFAVLAPYAARFPFETWLLPKQHHADFTSLGRPEIRTLALVLQDLLGRMRRVLKDPAYNLILHTAPLQTVASDYHWHLEIMPRLARVTGFEWGTDCYVNPTLPEEAARFLREAGAGS